MEPAFERLGGDQAHCDDLLLTRLEDIDFVIRRYFELARRRLVLRAVRLEFAVFYSAELAAAIGAFIRAQTRNQLLLLLEDDVHFLRQHPRLIELARRYSSYITVRRVTPDYVEGQELYLVADEVAWLRQPRIDRKQLTANPNGGAVARRLARQFAEVWEHSDAMPEIFTLGL